MALNRLIAPQSEYAIPAWRLAVALEHRLALGWREHTLGGAGRRRGRSIEVGRQQAVDARAELEALPGRRCARCSAQRTPVVNRRIDIRIVRF